MYLLQYQIQRCLDRLESANPGRFEVRVDWATLMRSLTGESLLPAQLPVVPAAPGIQESSEIRATLFVLDRINLSADPMIRWVIDVVDDALMLSAQSLASLSNRRAQLCARLAIADYWLLMPAQAALRTYHRPISSGYGQQQLWHVGEQVSPTAIPEITLRIQEALPIYFLTRTLKGPRAYESRALPLQVC